MVLSHAERWVLVPTHSPGLVSEVAGDAVRARIAPGAEAIIFL